MLNDYGISHFLFLCTKYKQMSVKLNTQHNSLQSPKSKVRYSATDTLVYAQSYYTWLKQRHGQRFNLLYCLPMLNE